jgi:hypothetical protein
MQGHNHQHLPHKFTKLSKAKETKTLSIPVRGKDPFHSICGHQDLGERGGLRSGHLTRAASFLSQWAEPVRSQQSRYSAHRARSGQCREGSGARRQGLSGSTPRPAKENHSLAAHSLRCQLLDLQKALALRVAQEHTPNQVGDSAQPILLRSGCVPGPGSRCQAPRMAPMGSIRR